MSKHNAVEFVKGKETKEVEVLMEVFRLVLFFFKLNISCRMMIQMGGISFISMKSSVGKVGPFGRRTDIFSTDFPVLAFLFLEVEESRLASRVRLLSV